MKPPRKPRNPNKVKLAKIPPQLNVVCFSGGRTSGYMLHRLIKQHGIETIRNEWKVLFANTGRERNETLDFVRDVEVNWGVPIVWMEYTRVKAEQWIVDLYPHHNSKRAVLDDIKTPEGTTHWFRVVDWSTAKRIGDENLPFDEMLDWMNVLPNVRGRGCTGQLKVRTMTRYLLSQGLSSWSDNIGIRADESDRSIEIIANSPRHVTPRFPLIELGVNEAEVLDFWKRQPFNLQLQSYEGNCDLCFLKSREKKHRLIQENPGSVDWWKWREWKMKMKLKTPGDGAVFRKSHEYERLEAEAKSAVLPEYTRDDISPISCGCFDGGHESVDLSEAAK